MTGDQAPAMTPEQKAVLDEWLTDRPQVIRDLAYAYPPDCYTFNDTASPAGSSSARTAT